MKQVLLIFGTILVLLVGYVAAGPYMTVSAIKTGMTDQESEKLSENIEFPVLRQNLKDQLNVAMMKNTASNQEENPFAILMMGLGKTRVEGIVDSFVTPSGLAALMEGKKPSKDKTGERSSSPPKKDDLFKNARFAYDSTSKFSIWVPNEEGGEVRFVLLRYDLSWKLANIIAPMDENS